MFLYNFQIHIEIVDHDESNYDDVDPIGTTNEILVDTNRIDKLRRKKP